MSRLIDWYFCAIATWRSPISLPLASVGIRQVNNWNPVSTCASSVRSAKTGRGLSVAISVALYFLLYTWHHAVDVTKQFVFPGNIRRIIMFYSWNADSATVYSITNNLSCKWHTKASITTLAGFTKWHRVHSCMYTNNYNWTLAEIIWYFSQGFSAIEAYSIIISHESWVMSVISSSSSFHLFC